MTTNYSPRIAELETELATLRTSLQDAINRRIEQHAAEIERLKASANVEIGKVLGRIELMREMAAEQTEHDRLTEAARQLGGVPTADTTVAEPAGDAETAAPGGVSTDPGT